MTEDFLQHIWKNKLFDHHLLKTQQGEEVEIFSLGERNLNSGPDFFNARIKINKTIWAGNVEVHSNSSDWYKHNHQKDKTYDNVILHVVYNYDQEVKRTNGEIIPAVELKFNRELYNRYVKLFNNRQWIYCENEIRHFDRFFIECWLNNLMIERLERKSNDIFERLKANRNNWEEVFYRQLAKNMGFKVNAEPFELLAKSIPLKHIHKHKDQLIQIEALLFGQAGLLEEVLFGDEYFSTLRKEYIFLKHKYNLSPIPCYLWKFMRLRPVNFPTLRIAQFAALLYKSSGLFSQIVHYYNIGDLRKIFNVAASEYWNTHFTFHKMSSEIVKELGDESFNTLVINTIVPFLFVYGKSTDNDDYKNKAILLLENMDPENNSIIRHWAEIGITASNAFYSQALLQLKNDYCQHKKCLNCRIGNKIISRD